MPLPKAWEKFDLVTLDFETFFSDEYTLKKLTTVEYVRDPRFKAHCLTLRINDGPIELVMHKDIAKRLKKIKWNKSMLAAHNCQFDGFILSHHYGIVPAAYIDTLSMARMLHGKEIRADLDSVAAFYKRGNKLPDVLLETKGIENLELPEHRDLLVRFGAYNIKDTELCYDVLQDMLPKVPADEMEIIHHVIGMFCNPLLRLNVPLATQARDEELARRQAILERVILPEEVDQVRNGELLKLTKKERAELTTYQIGQKLLRNDDFMTRVLAEYGIEVPKKFSAAKGKAVPSFAKDGLTDLQNSLDMDAEASDEVYDLLQGRIDANSTITVSRADRMLSMAGADGSLPLPMGYHYGRTTTNRLSGGAGTKANPQNFTRGGKLRRAIQALPGHQLVVMDSSQIEARCTPYLAGFDEKLQGFKDYDVITGAVVYLKADLKKPEKERRTKVVKFNPATTDLKAFVTEHLLSDAFKEFTRAGPDVYRISAAGIYSKSVDLVTKDERQIGKVGELALGFLGGAGAFNSMARIYGVKLPESMVKGIVNKWRKNNAPIIDFGDECEAVINKLCASKKARGVFGPNGMLKYYWQGNVAMLELPSGFTIKYPGLVAEEGEKFGRPAVSHYYNTVEGRKHLWRGLVVENLVQAFARDVVFWQCLQLIREWQHRGVRWVMSTHDEGVFHIPEALKQEFMRRAVHWFFSAPPWAADLPVAGDGGVAVNYSK